MRRRFDGGRRSPAGSILVGGVATACSACLPSLKATSAGASFFFFFFYILRAHVDGIRMVVATRHAPERNVTYGHLRRLSSSIDLNACARWDAFRNAFRRRQDHSASARHGVVISKLYYGVASGRRGDEPCLSLFPGSKRRRRRHLPGDFTALLLCVLSGGRGLLERQLARGGFDGAASLRSLPA
jgi:hypothetical protein